MFRRLYWVTELLGADGKSQVTGIYTSVPDLVHRGLKRPLEANATVRLSLVQVDSEKAPLGVWSGPEFAGLEDGCAPFIRTEEFGVDEIRHLAESLRRPLVAA